jgi:hypothetical protein
LSTKKRGRGNPSWNCKQTSWLEKAGVAAPAQQPGPGKLVKVAVGGKLHWRGGKEGPFTYRPFSFFTLPLTRKQPNYTCMLKNILKLYCV